VAPVVERRPWSVLGPEFIAAWCRPNGKFQPENLEVIGQNGSGKSFLLVQILVEMVRRRSSSVIYIATKQADKTIAAMGWPVVDSWREVRQHEQVVFWPKTSRTGKARKAYQAAKIQELLDNLWGGDANTIVVFDEFAYVESLDQDLKDTLQMYLREGRSHGICCVAGKQRVQGVQRDMHSESVWTVIFPIKDRDDRLRAAELLGGRAEWMPALSSLSKARHEFLIQYQPEDSQYISWVDAPVDPKVVAAKRNSYRR
jgi:nucleoside-triphosphatase THEP1